MQKRVKVRAVPCEVYSRVVGYCRPVSQWNEGKKQEFSERAEINLSILSALETATGPLKEGKDETL